MLLFTVLALFGGTLRQGDAVLLGAPRGDMLLQYLPWRVFGFGEMARGNLALWNPHLFSGRPFLGDFQSALLYPPNLIHLLLPHRFAINLTFVLHVWLAGVLTYAWARRNDLGRPAATLGGLVCMFGAPFFLHLEAGHLTHVCTMAWTPAALWCLDETIRAGRAGARRAAAGWVLAGMVAAALQVLAGHPQFAYYTALVSGGFALAHVIVPGLGPLRPWPLARRTWPLVAWAAVWAGGAALAAAQVLGGIDAARESGRWQETGAAFSGTFSLPLENLLTLVAPARLGRGRAGVLRALVRLGGHPVRGRRHRRPGDARARTARGRRGGDRRGGPGPGSRRRAARCSPSPTRGSPASGSSAPPRAWPPPRCR